MTTFITTKKNWIIIVATIMVQLSLLGNAQTPTPSDAIALEQRGELDEATRAWIAVTRHNPGDAAAFASLGVVLSKQQKYPEAGAAYKKALALDPKLPGVNLNLGLCEFKQGHFSAAERPLHAALA